ncbi:MAG TPA: tetratricopeptide repeat protein, partial [Geobacteraceae bacterium]|nr:tetratricopeptide repeat protein [Geobacteraceae bacterium]
MEKESASFWAGIKKFEDILASNPNAYSFAPLAEIYRKLGLADEALRIAQRGVVLHPEFAAGQMALASSCLDKNMFAEARQALEVVVRITPENLDAQKLLADLYQADGNVAAASACLKVVAELEPDFAGGTVCVETPVISAAPVVEEKPVVPVAAVAEAFAMEGEEEILEADILELTDDLIEEEAFEEEPYSPFAAAPPRPSLLVEKEKVETPAAPQPVVQVPASAPPGGAADFLFEEEIATTQEATSQPTVLTGTIAELYVSQG